MSAELQVCTDLTDLWPLIRPDQATVVNFLRSVEMEDRVNVEPRKARAQRGGEVLSAVTVVEFSLQQVL